MKRASDKKETDRSRPKKRQTESWKREEERTSARVHPVTTSNLLGMADAEHRLRLAETAGHQHQLQQRASQPLTFPPYNDSQYGYNAAQTDSFNSILASYGQSLGISPSANVPSLLAGLPMHHQPLPHQNQLYPLATLASRATASDTLAQVVLASQLSRRFPRPPLTWQELQLLCFANSIQQEQQRHQQDLIGRLSQGLQLHGGGGTQDAFTINPTSASAVVGVPQTQDPKFPRTNPVLTPQVAHTQEVAMAPDADCVPLALETDRATLSEYQCLIREQIDLFAAKQADIDCSAQGRNRPIVIDQVGIRCRHCASLPSSRRSRGAVYFPARLSGL